MTTRKRRHHYVPKFYLKQWATEGRVYCLREGLIIRPTLKHVAVEEDFYAVQDLTLEDIEVLKRGVIDPSAGWARRLHLNLFRSFEQVAWLNRAIAQKVGIPADAKSKLRELISNLDENYHNSIERDLEAAIRCMLGESVEFFSDVTNAGAFLRALALQSLRTKRMRERMRTMVQMPQKESDMDRIFGPMIHMLAVNVGGCLLVDRANYRITLLRNETGVPFLTGDQPVINVCSDRDANGIPRDVTFYYPLSPTVAMLYQRADAPRNGHVRTVNEAEVRAYNAKIVAEHHDQVYSDSESFLVFRGMGKNRRTAMRPVIQAWRKNYAESIDLCSPGSRRRISRVMKDRPVVIGFDRQSLVAAVRTVVIYIDRQAVRRRRTGH